MSKNQLKLGDALQELLQQHKLDSKLDEVNLINSWKEVVGKVVDKHTSKLYFNASILYIHLDSAALKQELTYSKSRLIQALNEYVKKELVKDIVIR